MNNNDIVFDIIKKSKKHLTAYEILDKFQKFKKIQPMAVYRSLKKLIEEIRYISLIKIRLMYCAVMNMLSIIHL